MASASSKRGSLTFYRLWCGRKRYTHWIADLDKIWRIAIDKGLAYRHPPRDIAGLGPLTWIEHGTRKYARSATISLGKYI